MNKIFEIKVEEYPALFCKVKSAHWSATVWDEEYKAIEFGETEGEAVNEVLKSLRVLIAYTQDTQIADLPAINYEVKYL